VHIPDDTELAPGVTIYSDVMIGRSVTIEQAAIIGRPQQIDARSKSPRRPTSEPTLIGDGCRIGSSTVVVAGARIGHHTYLGDLVTVREGAVLGNEVMIGRGCAVTHSTEIGNRVRIQNDTLVGAFTVIEDDAFVGARVVFIGDPTMGRGGVDPKRNSTIVRQRCRIGSCAIVMPPAELGEEAVVGAASLVRGDVASRTVVVGSPAQPIRMVAPDELFEPDAMVSMQ
jgi:acetyltransferase-like isoleucine patch superfamily enzyme